MAFKGDLRGTPADPAQLAPRDPWSGVNEPAGSTGTFAAAARKGWRACPGAPAEVQYPRLEAELGRPRAAEGSGKGSHLCPGLCGVRQRFLQVTWLGVVCEHVASAEGPWAVSSARPSPEALGAAGPIPA